MFRVVVGLLRHGSRGDCPEIGSFSQSLSGTLTNLQGTLAREEVDQSTMLTSIHAVLYEVFIIEQQSLASERQLPLVQYLIFCMLDYEGNFKGLHEVRHFSAILTYWCRLVVFVEISKQDQAEQR
jgi:hypothetical protein